MSVRERDMHLFDMDDDADFDERTAHNTYLIMRFLYSLCVGFGMGKVDEEILDPWKKVIPVNREPAKLEDFRSYLMTRIPKRAGEAPNGK